MDDLSKLNYKKYFRESINQPEKVEGPVNVQGKGKSANGGSVSLSRSLINLMFSQSSTILASGSFFFLVKEKK